MPYGVGSYFAPDAALTDTYVARRAVAALALNDDAASACSLGTTTPGRRVAVARCVYVLRSFCC